MMRHAGVVLLVLSTAVGMAVHAAPGDAGDARAATPCCAARPVREPTNPLPLTWVRVGGVLTVLWLAVFIGEALADERREHRRMAPFRPPEDER